MNWLLLLIVFILFSVNYYYIDMFQKMQKDIKTIMKYIEERK